MKLIHQVTPELINELAVSEGFTTSADPQSNEDGEFLVEILTDQFSWTLGADAEHMLDLAGNVLSFNYLHDAWRSEWTESEMLELCNTYNASRMVGRAFIDDDGEQSTICLDHYLRIKAGVSIEVVANELALFTRAIEDFLEMLDS
jgi:hypothetical protein